jgi:hypothetical protein
MVQEGNNKAAPGTPRRAALFSSAPFWEGAAAWSIVLFATVVGASSVLWALWTGDEGGRRLGFALRRGEAEIAAPEEEPQAEPKERRPLDGMPVETGGPPRAYYAVMIDNFSAARPPAGLSAASLVIEAPVEGPITRLLAVFGDDAAAERVGPVRSARPYFLDWAMEFDALYVHVGGSPEALGLLAGDAVRGMNEFSFGAYFWRDQKRRAPHNTYTSLELMKKNDERRFPGREHAAPEPWRFKEDAPEDERAEDGAVISIPNPERSYAVRWTYDRAANGYVREQGGSPHAEEGNGAVRAKNVVIQYVKTRVLDEVGRKRIETIGEGEALAAIDGNVVSAKWKKGSKDARTRFYDAAGNELAFNAGTTWIEVVADGTDITY